MHKLNKNIVWVIIVLAVVLVLVWGFSLSGNIEKKEVITFGFVGPLTGDVATIGQQNKQAIEMAVEEINSAGGIDGKMIEFIFEDGRCNAKDAASAGSKLINIDQVKYIVGGECSGETLAIAPLAEEERVVMISPVSSSPDVTNAGDYIFRDYINDNDAGKVLAQKIWDAGHKKAALLWSLNDYSQGLSDVFNEEFISLGGEISVKEPFVQGSSDLRSIVSKVKNSNADVIVIFEYTSGTVTFFKQKEELGLDLPVYGADTFSDPAIIEGAGEAVDGTKYVLVKNSFSDEFKQKLTTRTGDNDIQIGSTQAYDAVYIFANAIDAVGDDSEKVKDWLYDMPAYNGESGVVKFDENGDLTSSEFDLWEIVDGKPVIIE